MRQKIPIAVAAVVAACFITGCDVTSPDRSYSADPGQGKAATVADAKLRDLTVEDEIEVERAEQRLVKACMAEQGFPYWEFPVPGVDERRAGRYVTDDVRWAKKYGYGRLFGEKAEEVRLTHPTVTYQKKLAKEERAAYSKALDGDWRDAMTVELPGGTGTIETPRGGCSNEARKQLYGDPETWFTVRRTITGLMPLYVPDVMKDKRFTESLEKWSRCMEKAGRPFDNPDKLRAKRDVLTEGMPFTEANKFDTELAVIDATCAKESSLGEIARSLEITYLEKVLERYGKENAEYRKMRLNALVQARKTLS
ncbi:hypothetical protein QF037_010231 [Streptomyces canus]|uniref:hypothetical protein n=1 Tax=Streptomyces canus TaxID=58343 RepID=UPI00278394E5|nr:hypothetical protein [Streptomyces canus]MDQ0605798.1 hypothetical protein [Streptomyces canus]